MDDPKTLLEAVQVFADLDTCHAYMIRLKWPDGRIVCPKCGSDRVGNVESRRMLQCKNKTCRKQFSAKVGTIFEDSPLPLSQWFVAVWCIANFKMGISSHELARTLGITQKSAWFMLHRIRLAMTTASFRKLNGVVESDETFIGGLAANMHAKVRERKIRGRGAVNKTIVHGLLERNSSKRAQDSQVKATVVSDTEAATLMLQVARNVEPAAFVCTDASASYASMSDRFVHRWIDHAFRYVAAKVHINGIENFWALVKRMLHGTYVHCAPFHLFRYLDEEVWRFNERRLSDGRRFELVMQSVLGLTYRVLCGTEGAGFMGLT